MTLAEYTTELSVLAKVFHTMTSALKVLNSPIRVLSGSHQMQSQSGLVSDLRPENTFTLQMDSSDAQSRITFAPIKGEVVFPEAVTISAFNFKTKLIRY